MPTSDFIIAEAGLCNKLRALLSYREMAMRRGRHLVVLWRQGPFCDALFNQLFEPLGGVTFIDAVSELEQPHREALAAAGGEAAAHVYDSHPSIKYTEAETCMYSSLAPLPAIRAAVSSCVAACGGRFVAVHMRRTDHVQMFGDRTPDASFFAFLDRHAHLPILLATDNAETQELMARRYGHRVRALGPIEPLPQLGGQAAPDSAGTERHTTLERAVADLFICVEAEAFMGTYMSSFSDAIALLRRAGGRDVSKDEHVVRSLGGKHYDPDEYSVELPEITETNPLRHSDTDPRSVNVPGFQPVGDEKADRAPRAEGTREHHSRDHS
jgi:hypothetical protein